MRRRQRFTAPVEQRRGAGGQLLERTRTIARRQIFGPDVAGVLEDDLLEILVERRVTSEPAQDRLRQMDRDY